MLDFVVDCFNYVASFFIAMSQVWNLSIFVEYLYVDLVEVVLIMFIGVSFWCCISFISFSNKFFYFLLVICSFSLWGFWASYDGLVLMLLLSELLFVLIFLLNFLAYNYDNSLCNVYYVSVSYYWLGLISVYLYSLVFTVSGNFSMYDFVYLYCLDIVGNDLFLIFYLYFIQAPIIVVYIGTLLGLISIIFSALFFCFSFYKGFEKSNSKIISIFSNQQTFKQARFSVQMSFFQ